MATIRQRGNTFEARIKHRLLNKPIYRRDPDRAALVQWAEQYETLLAKNIVPEGANVERVQHRTIGQAIREYRKVVTTSPADRAYLDVVSNRVGADPIRKCDYEWAEQWISTMKRVNVLTPTTIKHHVGALARCFDWLVRGEMCDLPRGNILRTLPRRYAHFTETDAALTDGGRVNNERDRRLETDEEESIRRLLSGAMPESKKILELKWRAALECMFDLAIETAMRMRESYTVDLTQVSITKRTIFLDKTKNGDRRQVPLSKTAIASIQLYLRRVKTNQAGMGRFDHAGQRLFPWWDGDPQSLKATTALLSRQFARVFDAAGCDELRFHDLRHEATSRLFERTDLSDAEIGKITGHRDPRMLQRYANLRGSDLASRIG